MLNASSLPTPWTWPVNVERYDRTTELKQHEITALERNLPLLERACCHSV
jgi:hypothetical protein